MPCHFGISGENERQKRAGRNSISTQPWSIFIGPTEGIKWETNSLRDAENSLSEGKRLRFRIRKGDFEVELEGDHEYVREQFENLSERLENTSGPTQTAPVVETPTPTASPVQDQLEGIVQYSSGGRPHLTVPADTLSAKEALALVLFAIHPRPLGDDELSNLLQASWKTTSGAVVRARASELKREGKLIAEKGTYILSGAGIQWVKSDIIPNLKKMVIPSPA